MSIVQNRQFAMIGLTVSTRKPVMCILIIEWQKFKGNIKAGIGFTVSSVENKKKVSPWWSISFDIF